MTEQPEGRQHPRYPVVVDAEVHAQGHTLVAYTRDVSRGGICLLCPREVEPGTTLGLSLSLKLGAQAFSENLELSGRVIWCTPVGQMFQVGAVFIEMTPTKVTFLDLFLRFLQQEFSVPTGEHPPMEEPFDTGDSEN